MVVDNVVAAGALKLNWVAAFVRIQTSEGGGITLYSVGALDCNQQLEHQRDLFAPIVAMLSNLSLCGRKRLCESSEECGPFPG